MKYNFRYQTKARDIWQLTMYNIYSNYLLRTVHIIFTIAMISLTIKFWPTLNLPLRIGVIAGMLLFVAIQPFLIYMSAKKKALHLPREIILAIDDTGLHIQADNETTDIKWYSVKGIVKKPTLLVIVISNQQGYILSNRVLSAQRDEVYQFVKTKIHR
jgi:hypothetical protein